MVMHIMRHTLVSGIGQVQQSPVGKARADAVHDEGVALQEFATVVVSKNIP